MEPCKPHLVIALGLFCEARKLGCQLLWVSCGLIHNKTLNPYCGKKMVALIIYEVQEMILFLLVE